MWHGRDHRERALTPWTPSCGELVQEWLTRYQRADWIVQVSGAIDLWQATLCFGVPESRRR
jgi:hypothetical protein